jgi:ABC-2 type transport system ATP-binding protein
LHNKIEKLIALVGLEYAKHKEIASYSSGMKQRLAMARGLLCDPQILILDEPTRALDPQAVKDVKNLVSQKIHEDRRRTLLIATHRFDEVDELCNKACVMQGGKLISYDTIAEIKSQYGTVENYYHKKMAIK